MIIIGPPGSGKTLLLKNILTHKKLYNKSFDYTLWITPYKEKGDKLKKGVNWMPKVDLTWIYKIIYALNMKKD